MISVEDMKRYGHLVVTTTTNEKFEITTQEDGYLLKDNVPPIEETPVAFIHSIKPTKGTIDKAKPEQTLQFNGIAKGFHFAWGKEDSTRLVLTKGRIDSCTVHTSIAGLEFNLELLEASGRKFAWSDLGTSFSVKTASSQYDFEKRDGKYYFEGRRLVGILSLYKSKDLGITDLYTHASEYDAAMGMLFYNRLFIILTEDKGEVKVTFPGEPVFACIET